MTEQDDSSQTAILDDINDGRGHDNDDDDDDNRSTDEVSSKKKRSAAEISSAGVVDSTDAKRARALAKGVDYFSHRSPKKQVATPAASSGAVNVNERLTDILMQVGINEKNAGNIGQIQRLRQGCQFAQIASDAH
jgi:hypothetical protein